MQYTSPVIEPTGSPLLPPKGAEKLPGLYVGKVCGLSPHVPDTLQVKRLVPRPPLERLE